MSRQQELDFNAPRQPVRTSGTTRVEAAAPVEDSETAITRDLFLSTICSEGNGSQAVRLALWLDWMNALAAHGRPLDLASGVEASGDTAKAMAFATRWILVAMHTTAGTGLLPVEQWDETQMRALFAASGKKPGDLIAGLLGAQGMRGGAGDPGYAATDRLLARMVHEAGGVELPGSDGLATLVRGGSEDTLDAVLAHGAAWTWGAVTGIRSARQWDIFLTSGIDPTAPFNPVAKGTSGNGQSPALALDSALRNNNPALLNYIRKTLDAREDGARQAVAAQCCADDLLRQLNMGAIDKVLGRHRGWAEYPAPGGGTLADAWLHDQPESATYWMVTRGRVPMTGAARGCVGRALATRMHPILHTLGVIYANRVLAKKTEGLAGRLLGSHGEGLLGQVPWRVAADDNGLMFEGNPFGGNGRARKWEVWSEHVSEIPPALLFGNDPAAQAQAARNLRGLLGCGDDGRFWLSGMVRNLHGAMVAAANTDGLICDSALRAEIGLWHGLWRRCAAYPQDLEESCVLDTAEWAIDPAAMLPLERDKAGCVFPGREHIRENAAVNAILQEAGPAAGAEAVCQDTAPAAAVARPARPRR